MNLMETLLQNEYTKCNESIPYKTFDHYTVRDFRTFWKTFFIRMNIPKKSYFVKEIAYGIKYAESVHAGRYMLQRNIFQTLQEGKIKPNSTRWRPLRGHPR